MKRSYLDDGEDEDPDTWIAISPVGCGLTMLILLGVYAAYRLM